MVQLYSDLYFGHTSNEQAVSQSVDTPVYWYLYNYVYENGNVDELYGIKSDDAFVIKLHCYSEHVGISSLE